MSTSFERLLGVMIAVIAGLALSLGFVAALPGMAEAQDMAEASMEAEQNANLSNVSNANVPATAPPESQQGARLVVSPGDSLWSISQQQLGLEATPQEIAVMADQIYEQNRDRIGDNPDLMFPSQELLVPLGLNPAAASEEPTAAAAEPTAAAAASEEPMLEQAPEPVIQSLDTPSNAPTGEEAVSEEENTPVPVSSADSLFARRLLGLGILALTLIVAILIVWRLPMRRDVGDHTASRGLHWEYYKDYAPPEAAEGLEGEIEEATSERGSNSSPTRGEDAMPASDQKVASPPAVGPQERLRSAHQLRKIPQRRRGTPR